MGRTIDVNGAMHDALGRYANQQQRSASFDLSAPKPAPSVPRQLGVNGPNRKPRRFVTGDSLAFSDHFKDQMRAKGFTQAQAYDALKAPYKITEVTGRDRQWRFCGRGPDGQQGIAIVVAFDGPKPRVVTCYLDGIRTALREDQMNDPRALASQRALR